MEISLIEMIACFITRQTDLEYLPLRACTLLSSLPQRPSLCAMGELNGSMSSIDIRVQSLAD